MAISETIEKFLKGDICFYHAEVTGTCNPIVKDIKLGKMYKIIFSDIIKEMTQDCDPQEKVNR